MALAIAALAMPVTLLHAVARAADPVPSAVPSASPPSDPSPTPDPTASPTPDPTASPTPDPTASPTPTPDPTPTPAPTAPPTSLNLYSSAGFRYQDPNWTACTATSAQDMLNFIAIAGSGGPLFHWRVSLSGSTRDTVLRFERAHDTLAARAAGTDPHGWRNALNYYGWGSGSLVAGQRVYEDVGFTSYTTAMQTAVRQMILTRKPVGVLGWAGHHAQMLTGYYGLHGDPLAKRADGSWANAFTVDGLYVTDPLRSDAILNRRVSYTAFYSSTNLHLRFRRDFQTDSPYDDPYTPGFHASRTEWYNRYTLLVPVR